MSMSDGFRQKVKKGLSTISCVAAGAMMVAGLWAAQPSYCSAEIVEGMAPITRGNAAAREEALQNAMRDYVEAKVGVNVNSYSEVNMGILVTDKIVTRSDGYVQIKKIISEGARGNIYYIKADIEADDKKIELKYADDVKAAIEAMARYNSRKTIDVAVVNVQNGRVQHDERATTTVAQYMKSNGMNTNFNANLSQFMVSRNNPTMAELRQQALLNRTTSGAVLCGRIEELAMTPVSGGYMAEVEGYFQVIGLDNNLADPYEEYFTYVGRTENEARAKARQLVAAQAAQALAKSALSTMQTENQGGQHWVSTEISITGLPMDQAKTVKNILTNLNCDIISAGFDSTGAFRVLFEVAGYNRVSNFTDVFEEQMAASGIRLSQMMLSGGDMDPKIKYAMY